MGLADDVFIFPTPQEEHSGGNLKDLLMKHLLRITTEEARSEVIVVGHYPTMSQSFADKDTQELFQRETNRRFSAVARVALRKLIQMNRARVLQDLAIPPGNRLEALKENLTGYHSIRINDQWRIVFAWTDHGPAEVTICDYH